MLKSMNKRPSSSEMWIVRKIYNKFYFAVMFVSFLFELSVNLFGVHPTPTHQHSVHKHCEMVTMTMMMFGLDTDEMQRRSYIEDL